VAQDDNEQSAGEAPPPPETDDRVPTQPDFVEDPKAFILSRELSEVHLLIDNLSASPDTTISALAAQERTTGLEADWLDRICRISWPPHGTQVDQAAQAALLIKVKDYLNRLSKPASGSTIAFTLLVTQGEEEADEREPHLLAAPAALLGLPALAGRPGPPPSRPSLASTAYPDLLSKARNFRRAMRLMSFVLLGWLVLTCLLSWYVAVGNAALADLKAARAQLADAEVRIGNAHAGLTKPGETPAITVFRGDYCPTATMDAKGRSVGPVYPSMELSRACQEKKEIELDIARLDKSLDGWALWGSGKSSAWYANLLGSGVLPVLYGFLGAGAAIVRSLSRKIKASTLSPRDLHLSFQQLALGAVIGACIGLFIAHPGAGAEDEASLLGPVALSGSAISFVAGFGVEAVFQALEALISRIFNIAPAASPAGPDGPPRD
jgi:hypothetical protein